MENISLPPSFFKQNLINHEDYFSPNLTWHEYNQLLECISKNVPLLARKDGKMTFPRPLEVY